MSGGGVVDQSGTATLTSNPEINIGWTNGWGVYNLTGGTVSVSGNGHASAVGGRTANYTGNNATGILSISGGLFQVSASGSQVGVQFSKGIVNLGGVGTGGGVLSTQFVQGDTTGTSVVNFHGGTLQAGHDDSNFLSVTSAYVYGEGGTIDTNNHTVTISANLQSPTGSGLTSIPFTPSGTAYIGAPAVQITGGNGDATAKATVNPATGKVTGIVITNPGTGYDVSPPVVTLVGGGGTGAATGIGSPTLVANVSGGLTKIGAGTLILSGYNSYTGTTIVNAGTLLVNGTQTGGVTVNNTGSVLGGYGTIGGAVTLNGNTHLSPGQPVVSDVGTLTVTNNFTAAAGSIFDFDFSTSPGNDQLLVTGSGNPLTLNGGGFNLYGAGTNSPFSAPGTYQLIQYAGTLGGNVHNLSVLNPQPYKTYTFNTTSNTGWVDLVITSQGTPWTGATNTTWATASNWAAAVPGGIGTTTNGDVVLFNANPANLVPDIDAGRNVKGILFDTVNVGPVTLGTTGGNALNLSSGGSIQTTFVVANDETINAPLVLEGASATYTLSSDSASNALIFGGSIKAGAAGSTTLVLTGASTAANSINGVLANGSATQLTVVKNGTGTWFLTGANTYSGGTTIGGGTLNINADGALGVGNLTFSGPGTLQVGVDGIVLGTGHSVAIQTGETATFDTNGYSLTVAGVVSGNGNLTVAGAGTLMLPGTNTYGGATTLVGGTLVVASIPNGNTAGPIGSSSAAPANLVFGGGTLQYTGVAAVTDRGFTIAGDTTIDNASDLSFTGQLVSSGTYAFTKTNAGTLTLGNAATNISVGAFNVNAGALALTGGTIAAASFQADNASGIALSNAVVLNVASDVNFNPATGPGGNFAITINGGQFNAAGHLEIGQLGTTTVTLSGNAVLSAANYITLGPNNGTSNTTFCALRCRARPN